MISCRIPILLSVCFLFLISACSTTPHTTQLADISEDPTSANQFVDWNKQDWKFLRATFAQFFIKFPTLRTAGMETYREKTGYDGTLQSTTMAEFLALTPEEQSTRRAAAEKRLFKAMAFHRLIAHSWQVSQNDGENHIMKELQSYKNGIITETIQHFETAVGLDPTNPYTWSHLGYFCGLVGDRYRQLNAMDQSLNILASDEYATNSDKNIELLHLRLLLDRSWLLRDMGCFVDGVLDVNQAITLMANDNLNTFDLAREAILLQSLLMVDQGFIHKARANAKQLGRWQVPFCNTGSIGGLFTKAAQIKENMEHVDSNFGQDWVWAMTYLKQDEPNLALKFLLRKHHNLELPPHLNFRFWQDSGRIQEHFGEKEEAERSYVNALLYRPYFSFFPVQGFKGLPTVFNQINTGYQCTLGYCYFFLGGSYYSYAANMVLALEIQEDPADILRVGRDAIEALTICINQDNQKAAALALRGRVYFRMLDFEAAEDDLIKASKLLNSTESESSDVQSLLCVLQYNRGDFDQCLNGLKNYKILNNGGSFGLLLQGTTLAQLGKFTEAHESLSHALEIDPESAPGWYNRSLVNINLGNHDQALTDLKQAHAIWPNNNTINDMINRFIEVYSLRPQLTHNPIAMEISEAEKEQIHNSRALQNNDLSSRLDMDNLNKQQAEYKLDKSPEIRQKLALALETAGQMKDLQKLLADYWPGQVSAEEAMILLKADRYLGDPTRAIEMANTIQFDVLPAGEPDLWAIAAIICLENGVLEPGYRALEVAIELDPNNDGLRQLRLKYQN